MSIQSLNAELQPKLGSFGPRIMALSDRLAEWSESADGLTCTYLTPTHRGVAAELRGWMQAAGMAAESDAVGNVVGRYASAAPGARTLILASHYDTVRNGGKYDGRLGILLPLVVIEHLHATGRTLPFNIELIAFSEEEGARFGTLFLASSAVAGRFDRATLELRDAGGVRLGDLMRDCGFDSTGIPAMARRAESLLGYIEVHIEQGPTLLQQGLPLGIVTAIAGGVRGTLTVTGTAGHAGTVPMALRHDAGAAAAEIILYIERRCSGTPTLVGTVGRLAVPDGSTNVIPGRCELSLDIRAGDDPTWEAAVADVFAEIDRVAQRRGVTIETSKMMRKATVPCAPRLQALLAQAIARGGVKPHSMASGAGHDAMMFHGLTDVAMLFVRCGNGGISHSPLETITAEDADIAARVMLDVLTNFANH